MYMMTQLAVTSQNGFPLNSARSRSLNLSSSLIWPWTPSYLAAHLSIQARVSAITNEKMHTPKPKRSAGPTPWFAAMAVEIGPLIEDPILATLRLIPKAKASSLPWNQEEMIALCATVMHSLPDPNMNRPSIIVAYDD